MLTVLLAEANPDLRDTSRGYLDRKGFQVETANDGLECLTKLRRFVPDVLILDLELLWGGGDGVLAFLREDPRFHLIRVVLTSAGASREFRESLVSPPVVQSLAKPFPLSALLEGPAFVAPGNPIHVSNLSRRPYILVVDDEVAIRDLLRTCLQHEGFDVRTAANGEEALDHCCDHADEIAVILLDVQMPGRDGPHTLDGIRELDRQIPVCFMTSDPGHYETSDLLRRGARHLFHKPFHMNDVVGVMRTLADEPITKLLKN